MDSIHVYSCITELYCWVAYMVHKEEANHIRAIKRLLNCFCQWSVWNITWKLLKFITFIRTIIELNNFAVFFFPSIDFCKKTQPILIKWRGFKSWKEQKVEIIQWHLWFVINYSKIDMTLMSVLGFALLDAAALEGKQQSVPIRL